MCRQRFHSYRYFSVQKIVDRCYCIDHHKHSGDTTSVVAVTVNEVNSLIKEVNDY